MMTDEEYIETQSQLAIIASLVVGMPLAEFIERAETADAIGPIIDPTLWMRGHDALRRVREHARALREFQRVVEREADSDREQHAVDVTGYNQADGVGLSGDAGVA